MPVRDDTVTLPLHKVVPDWHFHARCFPKGTQLGKTLCPFTCKVRLGGEYNCDNEEACTWRDMKTVPN